MKGVPAEWLGARFARLSRDLAARRLDLFLVTHPPNVAYLTGFAGSSGSLLSTPDTLILVSDTRYAEELARVSNRFPTIATAVIGPGASMEETIAAQIVSLGPARVGFESSHLSVRQHLDLSRRLEAAGCRAELAGLESVVEDRRLVKDTWEIQILREAGRRLSDVAKCILPKALEGTVERELAAGIEWELRQKGFDKPAFDTIVASGPNAALPHHRAGDRRLERHDLVVIDFGGLLGGYAVDMTRTVVIGAGPDPRQAGCLAAVAAAQGEAFRAARVGAAPEDVDAAARRVLAAADMDAAFTHGLGHGLGLEVHERPRLTKRRPDVAQDALAAGMAFTLEPGVYFPGWGGVRIEDDVLATVEGPEWLTEREER